MRQRKQRSQRLQRKNVNRFAGILGIVAIFAITLLFGTQPSHAQTTAISGKLIDRVCSVEDVYQQQAPEAKRCTLWVEASYYCPTGVCKSTYTVYCLNKAVDGRSVEHAYLICADPTKMQANSKTVIIQAYLRTAVQQLDGYGQLLGYGFQY